MRPEDESFTGLDTAHRGSRPRGGGRHGGGGGGAIYHMAVRNGSRAKGHCARAAAAYIQRAAEYSRDAEAVAELVYTESGHMPGWADADPTTYWDAADLWERRNGQLFKGVEFALPLALTPEERQDLAVGFAHYLTDAEQLPYTLAIHAGQGENPHCHLMISERGNDGVERDAEQWFKRYNAEEPELGGACKSRALQPKSWLLETRAAWAEQTNQALERAGLDVRIDHRSLEAQGIDRVPGVHLGPDVVRMEAREIETVAGTEARQRAGQNAALDAEQRREAAVEQAAERARAQLAATRAAVQSQQEDVTYERARPEPERESGRAGVEREGRDVGGAVSGLGDSDFRGAGGRLEAGREAGGGAGAGTGPDVGGGAGEASAAIADDARQRGRAPGELGRGVGEGDPQPPRPDQLAGGPAQGVGVGPEQAAVEGADSDRGRDPDRGDGGDVGRPGGPGAGAAGEGDRAAGEAGREVGASVGEYVRGGEGGDTETRRGGAAAVEQAAERARAQVAATRAARQQEEQAQREKEQREKEQREKEQARERERQRERDTGPELEP